MWRFFAGLFFGVNNIVYTLKLSQILPGSKSQVISLFFFPFLRRRPLISNTTATSMTRSLHCLLTSTFTSLFLFVFSFHLNAQCPQVEAIMVDACGTEQLNEFIIINSGGGFNTSDIQLSYDANNNILAQANNDINIDINNFSTDPTPCGLSNGNAGAITGCTNVTSIGDGFNVPANSIVILQTSAGSQNGIYNFASLCGAGQCVYVISSSCTRTAGGFTNAGAGLRTTIFQINGGGCMQTITYNQTSLVGGNGAYYLPLTNMYGNAGCVVPPSSPAPNPPSITDLPNVTVCDSYTLPVITGTNLTPNAAYFTGPNRTGTQLNAGDVITTSSTIYINDFVSGATCSDEESFTVTITPAPTVNQPADITVCANLPVNVVFSGTAGATFSWTNDNPAVGLGASGTGNISFTSANVSGQEVATITVTPNAPGCMGTPITFTITVDPRPTVDDPANITVCGGESVNVPLTGTGNPTFNWVNSNTAIGLGASGNGDINFTANTPVNTIVGNITITPVENGCTGPTQNFSITVTPLPNVNQPNTVVACGNSLVVVNFTGTPGATFSWTNDNTNIGLLDSGTGNISFTSANVSLQETAIITVIPTLGNCDGAPRTFIITINPTPTVDQPADESVCGGDLLVVNFTGNGNPVFSWTNNNTAIGLPASGSGDLAFTAANVASTQVATITVTPSAPGCPGTPETFTITVSPEPNVSQPANISVCAGAPVNVNFTGTAGATFTWTNSNTAVGLLSTNGTGNIGFTSANVATQQIATITITPILGNCDGTPRTFTITVNPIASVNDPADQSVCSGVPVNVDFSGVGNPTFNWTNSNPAIGLAASGSGNISFTAGNPATVQTGTITVTPVAPGCSGTAQTFTVTVTPQPSVTAPANVVQCAGTSVNINFSGSAGATFNWTNSNPAIGLGASGSGNINFSAASVLTQQIANFQVTPQIGTCSGSVQNFSVTINPAPSVNPIANISACGGDPVNVNFSGTGASYSWTNSNTAIGLGATGTGNISFTSAAGGGSLTGTITVTPDAAGCPGIPQTFTISIENQPSVTSPGNQTICGGTAANIVLSGTPGATYAWTNNNPAIGLAASGNGNLVFTTASVLSPQTATIIVTPQLGTCIGLPVSFTISVQPTPDVQAVGNQVFCQGDPININFTGSLANTVFNWTNDNINTGISATGNGNISLTAAAVAGTELSNIVVTPGIGVCNGSPINFTVTVNPTPVITNPGDQSVCGNQLLQIPLTGTFSPVINWSNSNTATGLGASGTGDISFTSSAVTAPETGLITVSSIANGCPGAVISFNINVVTVPVVTNPGSFNACGGSPLILNFSGQAGATYTWSNNNPNIGLGASGTGNLNFTTNNPSTTETAQISVTPQLGACTGSTVVFNITVQPVPALNISSNSPICAGESATLTVNTGTGFSWNVSQTTSSITVTPSLSTTYTVTVTTSPGCSTVLNSLVTVNQPSTTQIQQSSCNPADTGTVVVLLSNLVGCDSIVTTTTTLLPSSITNISGSTCNPTAVGVFTQNLFNILGCDSTVITTITFDPAQSDTTYLSASTCDPTQTGLSQVLLTGIDGCDSLIITNTSLNPSNTTLLTQNTCNPNNVGVFTQTLSNIFGCDSTVITTVVFVPVSNITTLNVSTCDPAQVGTTQVILTGFNGCDSTVITNTSLNPSNTTNLNQTTCNPNNAGVFTQTLSNIFGCDSTVITTVVFVPVSNITTLNVSTCDPTQVGTTQVILTGFNGCDSTVITNTSLNPSSTTNLNQTTCNPNNAGVFTQTLSNIFGCDSTVITTIVFDPALLDTTVIVLSTCDPNQTGGVQTVLQGIDGCDSTIITLTVFDPAICSAVASITATTPALCATSTDGTATFNVTAGSAPFQYNWLDGQGNTGTGFAGVLNIPEQITGLAPGAFSVTITQAIGPPTILTANIPAPTAINVQTQAALLFNGFAIGCNGAATGSASAQATGGTPGYQYSWSSGAIGINASGLTAGIFTVTATDANGCSSSATVLLNEPAALEFTFDVIRPDCGELLADLNIFPNGGVEPYKVTIDGNMVAGAMTSVGSGPHIISLVDANGCVADSNINVIIPTASTLSLPADTLILLGESLTITALTNLNVWDNLVWQPIPDTTCPNCLSQTWMPLETKRYTITIQDTFGCVSSASILVKVDRATKIYIPTIFSPNGDGSNDFWTISAGASVRQVEAVRIYDRWGNQVYDWDAPIEPDQWPGWDGNFNGKQAPPAVYVYYLWLRLSNGDRELKKGDLTIFR